MIDILLDKVTNDLIIENGDLKLGYSDEQHQKLLLLAEKGAYKENPLVGVGILKQLENENPSELLREIRNQFTSDGMTINSLSYDEFTGKLLIDAFYS